MAEVFKEVMPINPSIEKQRVIEIAQGISQAAGAVQQAKDGGDPTALIGIGAIVLIVFAFLALAIHSMINVMED